MNGKLQGRLPPLLREAGLSIVAAANDWLEGTFQPVFNARFAVPAREEGTAFLPTVTPLADILCEQHERQVGNDNTVTFGSLRLQIPEHRQRRRSVRAHVRVHVYPDGTMAIHHGPRRLADYDLAGRLLEQAGPTRQAA
jgi:hypothetical protein